MTWSCGQSDSERYYSRVSSLAASFSSGALTTSHWKYPLKNVFDRVTLTYQLGRDIPIFDLHDEWQDHVPVHSARRVVQHSHTMSKVLQCPLTWGVKRREYPSFLSMVSSVWVNFVSSTCLNNIPLQNTRIFESEAGFWKWKFFLFDFFFLVGGGVGQQ